MKKYLLLLIILLPVTNIFSQTTKGNFILSGGTSMQFNGNVEKRVYGGRTLDEDKINSFSFLPSIGYFVMDNLAIELFSDISISRHRFNYENDYWSSSTLILPNVLYYFPMTGKIRPLVKVGVGYLFGNKNIVYDTEASYSGIAMNLGGGISYFISEDISFNFGLTYTKSDLIRSNDNNAKIIRSNFGSNVGISVFL